MSLKKRVCHITFSSSGGAGIVAKRLQEGQSREGIESRLLSMTERNIQDLFFSNPLLVGQALIDFYGVRKTRNSHLFSLLRNGSNNFISEEVKNAEEILHLHWTPGVISMEQIRKYLEERRSIVWTLHDMWAFTGGCHHALECNQYESGCRNCPQTRAIFQRRAETAASCKRAVLSSVNKIHFVSPSKWLADKASSSSALINGKIHIVPNPIDCNVFKPGVKRIARAQYGIDDKAFVVGCSSLDLSDPMKNMLKLVEGLKHFSSIAPGQEIVLLAVGSGKLVGDGYQVVLTGTIDEAADMATTYQAMDVFVSLSLAENFPLTVAEATASGVPVICLEKGGMPEIVINGKTGRVIQNESQLPDALMDFVSDATMRHEMSNHSRNSAVKSFSLESVIKKYDQIYDEAKD